MSTGYGKLYSAEDKKIMKIAEDTLDPGADRVKEIVEFAREAGFNRIGIANCITFEKEAEQLEQLLCENGFNVARANCKLGRLPNEEILPGYKGVSCNPAGQAQTLEASGTELNIVMGLCLGHDMVFNFKSKVPTTTLLVKDRKYNHNTLSKFNQKP
jgi:uncharacterized metal-binding protein